MSTRPKPRINYGWFTIGTSPAPIDFYNVYTDDGKRIATRCAALLIQEHRPYWTAHSYDMTRAEMDAEGIDPRLFESRVVSADFDGGELVDTVSVGNFEGTYHRDELTDCEVIG